jgi:hypothetical protein
MTDDNGAAVTKSWTLIKRLPEVEDGPLRRPPQFTAAMGEASNNSPLSHPRWRQPFHPNSNANSTADLPSS